MVNLFPFRAAMKKNVKPALVLACVLAALGIGFYILNGPYQDHLKETRYAALVETLAKKSGMDEKNNFHEKMDTVRRFVNTNTRHAVDEEFRAVWDDKLKHHQLLLAFLDGRRATPPPYECSTRSALMGDILKSRGYKVHSVVAYRRDGDVLESHTFIRVYNDATGDWETQDPDYDLYWLNHKTGSRATFFSPGSAAIVPCNETTCGWGGGKP